MTTLNLEQLAAGLDKDTFGWQTAKDGIWVWRYYGQSLIRNATLEEPAEYTDVESPYTLVKAEGYTVILCDEAGRELEREDLEDYYEETRIAILAEMIDAVNPWRDIDAEYEEGRWEQAISAWEEREGAWA